jgi:death-on-curing protein
MVVRYLTRSEIETINKFLAIKYGFTHLTLQPGNLDLCVEAPQRIVFGEEIYPDKLQKAAVLMKELNKLHPFLAGNKRTAHEAVTLFLELNGYALSSDTTKAVDLSRRTASCSADIPDIFEWIKTCSNRSPWEPAE